MQRLLRAVLALALLAAAACAQALVLAVHEGAGDPASSERIRARYAPLAADLSRVLRQPVRIEPVVDQAKLRQGLARKAYALAMVHPAHLSIDAIKHSGYRLLAVTRGFQDYRASFMVPAGSPLTSLASLKGLRLVAPDEDSLASWLVRATLRDALGDARQVEITYTRHPDAVPFMIEQTLTHAGATSSPAVVEGWLARGGRVLATSRPVPVRHLIAGPGLSRSQVSRLREHLLGLDRTEAGRKLLAALGHPGFVAHDEAAMLEIGRWLGL